MHSIILYPVDKRDGFVETSRELQFTCWIVLPALQKNSEMGIPPVILSEHI